MVDINNFQFVIRNNRKLKGGTMGIFDKIRKKNESKAETPKEEVQAVGSVVCE